MSTDWATAAKRFQNTQPGVQSAGYAGTGSGSVPYAPGSTQWQGPSPQSGTSSPAPQQLPQSAGNGAGYQGYDPSQSASQGGGQQPQPNPLAGVMSQDQAMAKNQGYARALMARLQAQIERANKMAQRPRMF